MITGTSASETLIGTIDPDDIFGLDGNDTLDGGAGADNLFGGMGDDTYIIDNAGDVTVENLDEGTDTVQSSLTHTLMSNIENLTLTGALAINGTGNELSNVIVGNSAVNVLAGLGGKDTLDGGAGADSLSGGLGNDIYVVDNAGDAVIEIAGEGADIVKASITYTLGASVEDLRLIGSALINGTGNSGANSIVGNNVANTLTGLGGNDYIEGKLGDDIINGGRGDDVLRGSGDHDTLYGEDGIDDLDGGSGNDILIGGTGADYLSGGATIGVADTASYETAAVGVRANLENSAINTNDAAGDTYVSIENLYGSSFKDTLIGDAGANRLDGGVAGVDYLAGGLGDDVYVLDATYDATVEAANAGTDTVEASILHTLRVNVENLVLTGTANISGTGNTIANAISGNVGNNFLDGKTGNDTLTGGLGNDQFLFTTALGAANIDTVTDFNPVNDYLRLENAIFTGLAVGYLSAAAFVVGTAAADASDRIIYNSATGAVFFDADGTGAGVAQQFATLSTGLALAAGDIYVF
jgi:Ca2+-binding RTX toxin-like protein